MKNPNYPLVTFVVLSYNFADYIRECIDSILCQEGNYAFEVIIIDDASTDGTDKIIQSYDDDRIVFIRHNNNLGHAATVNEAMAAAKGMYVARIDGDDRYRPHFLNDTITILTGNPEVGLVYGDASIIDEKGTPTGGRSESFEAHSGTIFKGNEFVRLLEYNFICSPTVIARREAWEGALPAPGHLGFHDWYFTVMISRRYSFYYLNKIIADYRVHPLNLHSRLAAEKKMEYSTLWLLDKVYGEQEADAMLEGEKRRRKKRVYARNYFVLADGYFWFGMYKDANRAYLRALINRPVYIGDMGLMRRFFATLIGKRSYEFCKSLIGKGRDLPKGIL